VPQALKNSTFEAAVIVFGLTGVCWLAIFMVGWSSNWDGQAGILVIVPVVIIWATPVILAVLATSLLATKEKRLAWVFLMAFAAVLPLILSAMGVIR
jgi:hypothetical protein